MKKNHKSNKSNERSYSESKYIKAEKAIKRMVKNNRTINFAAVAREAGVSRTYVNNNKILNIKIKEYRDGEKNGVEIRDNMDEGSKNTIISSLEKKIKKLENENYKKGVEIAALNKELERFKLIVFEG